MFQRYKVKLSQKISFCLTTELLLYAILFLIFLLKLVVLKPELMYVNPYLSYFDRKGKGLYTIQVNNTFL